MKVGLTGGIGAGKSTVARIFADNGALVVDADALAREVVEPGTSGLAAVVDRFGAQILDADGALNRPALGRLVFDDAAARADLEAILHPRIAQLTAERVAQAAPGQIVVHDIPLLVELQRQDDYGLVVVVDAPQEVRLERLVTIRGMDAAAARSRIDAQATTAQRRAVADIWIENDGDEDVLRGRAQEAWERIVEASRESQTR